MTKKIRVKVDSDVCMASGYCLACVPEVFQAAPDGVAEVVCESPDPKLLERLRDAEAGCPTFAITVTEE